MRDRRFLVLVSALVLLAAAAFLLRDRLYDWLLALHGARPHP